MYWGTGCSGSESPSWTLKALAEPLQALVQEFTCSHEFAAELDEAKQEWIKKKCKLGQGP